MYEFGHIVREKRKAKGFTQSMLAERVGMTAVQLCKIEKGSSFPTLKTAERIAEALDASLAGLLSVDDQLADSDPSAFLPGGEASSIARFVNVRSGSPGCRFDIKVLKKILPAENAMLAALGKLGIPCSTMIPFVHSFKVDSNGARTVARYVRSSCAAGSVAFSDLAEALEFRNVRLYLFDMPDNEQSRSYFDRENRSLSIVLSKCDTPERHVYRIAYELAWAVLFGSFGFEPVRETPLRHRFAREFVSEFLMPEESVRFAVSQLGIRPNDWTLSSVAWLKSKFNVSAEAFALRLESLGLISERLRQKIREELHEYYKNHPKAMEPKPALSPLKIGLRLKLLEIAASKRGAEE